MDAKNVAAEDNIPTNERSWEAIQEKVEEIDRGMADGWKDDIDTLLVFAGLFSAVVTAFTIESLKKLSEDPEGSTVTLLKHISSQLGNQTSTAASLSPYIVPASYVRINTMWILSLILALVDALFCLVCKQWLREFRLPTMTNTPQELLALRCFRADSFEKWHIPKFLASLPIILEIALFLFFAGLLELLWIQHSIPFSLAVVAVGFAVLFYFGTTLLPTVDLIRQLFCIHPKVLTKHKIYKHDDIFMIPSMQQLCAYKSPQAFLVFKVISTVFRLPVVQRIAVALLERKFPPQRRTTPAVYLDSLKQNLYSIGSWALADLNLIRRFTRIPGSPDVYALKAFQWIIQEFQDTPTMTPHLRNVLKEQPPHAIMAAVFDRGFFDVSEDWNPQAVEDAVMGRLRGDHIPFTFSVAEIQLLHYNILRIRYPWRTIDTYPPLDRTHSHFRSLHPIQLHTPLTRIAELLGKENTFGVGLKFLDHHVKCGSDKPRKSRPVRQVVKALSQCIVSFSSRRHTRHTPERENSFIAGMAFVSREIANTNYEDPPTDEVYEWLDALDDLRTKRNLGKGYFSHPPAFFPFSLERLNTILLTSTPQEATQWFEDFTNLGAWTRYHHLSRFIFQKLSPLGLEGDSSRLEDVDWVSLFASPGPLSWERTLSIPRATLPILASDDALELLRAMNDYLTVLRIHVHQFIPYTWEHALECVRMFHGLPQGYFRKIPLPEVELDKGQFDSMTMVWYGGSFVPTASPPPSVTEPAESSSSESESAGDNDDHGLSSRSGEQITMQPMENVGGSSSAVDLSFPRDLNHHEQGHDDLGSQPERNHSQPHRSYTEDIV